MPPVVPFIPLIAAGIGAAGGITAAVVANKNKPQAPANNTPKSIPLAAGPASVSPLADEKTQGARRGIVPISTSPLGDTTDPYLKRSRLLGN